MVAPSYMLEHRPRPGRAKRLLNQQVIPAAINIAGALEAIVERVSVGIRRNPALCCCAALAIGAVAERLLKTRAATRSRD